MPAICTCPICGFTGNHGFNLDTGAYIGTLFYHTTPDGKCCSWISGKNGKIYPNSLACFKAQCPIGEQRSNWGKARIAELSGHPQTAKRYYDAWKAEYNL